MTGNGGINDDYDPSNPTGGQYGSGQSPRFFQWLSILVFSLIIMGSTFEAADSDATSTTKIRNQKWSVACSILSFIISLTVVILHMSPSTSILVVNTKIEGLIIIILTVLWCSDVAIVTDARNDLAVNENGAVKFGNLFYFSWGALFCSFILLSSYLKSVWNFDVANQIRNRSSRLSIWSALLVSSLVSMSSSASIYDNNCSSGGDINETETFCNRTILSITVGCIGTVLSLLIVASKIVNPDAPFVMESTVGAILFTLQAFGVAYTTSDSGPGAPLGNLYYSSWISFLCSFLALASLFEEYQAQRLQKEEEEARLRKRLQQQEEEETRLRKRLQQQEERITDSGREVDRFTYDDA